MHLRDFVHARIYLVCVAELFVIGFFFVYFAYEYFLHYIYECLFQSFLFVPDHHVSDLYQYLDLVIIFFGIHGSRQALFRAVILLGMQAAMDFGIFLALYVGLSLVR